MSRLSTTFISPEQKPGDHSFIKQHGEYIQYAGPNIPINYDDRLIVDSTKGKVMIND